MAELKFNIILEGLNKFKKQFENIQIGGKKAAKKEAPTKTGVAFAAAFGGAVGGFFGTMIKQLNSIKGLLNVIAALVNALVAPFVPILIGLMKPFFVLASIVMKKLLQSLGLAPREGGEFATGLEVSLTKLVLAIGGITGIIAGIAAGLSAGSVVLLGALAAIGSFFAVEFGKKLFEWLDAMGAKFGEWISGTIIKFDEIFGTRFADALIEITEGIIGIFSGLWESLMGLVTLDFGRVGEGLKTMLFGLWDLLKGIFLVGWSLLKLQLLNAFIPLLTLGSFLLDNLKNTFIKSFEVLSGIGSFIKDKILGFFGGGGGRSRSVGDAVISPNGNVITTNPNDFLIATQNPGELGGRGNTYNIEINVEGVMNDEVVSVLTRKLRAALNSQGAF